MRVFRRSLAVCSVLALACPVLEAQQPAPIRTGAELEQLLQERADIALTVPELGYSWRDEDVAGDPESGSVAVTHSKVIYYFVHWGPIEVDGIDEDYARQRIPKLWPGEGLAVQKVAPATVAGHPAVYAEAMPRRAFYRAFFLIWNCPETGRQFIADMNYNVAVGTPRAELDAELETTRHTLACHPGAPVAHLPGHPIRYDNPRYGLSFEHPANWFVFDNPYGVPHPAYRGLRDASVGSVLAWMQDMEVKLGFEWSRLPTPDGDSKEAMGVQVDLLRLAVKKAREVEGVTDFVLDEYETLRFGPTPVLKITGIAQLDEEHAKKADSIPSVRLMMLVAQDRTSNRRLVVSVAVGYHRKDGLLLPPDRSILDRWAVALTEGLRL